MSKPGTERGHIDINGHWVPDGYIGTDGVGQNGAVLVIRYGDTLLDATALTGDALLGRLRHATAAPARPARVCIARPTTDRCALCGTTRPASNTVWPVHTETGAPVEPAVLARLRTAESPEPDPRTAAVDGLRELADYLETHPNLPPPAVRRDRPAADRHR